MPMVCRFVTLIVIASGLNLGAGAKAFAGGVDQYGDPLPEGAIARLGAKRFRHDGLSLSLTYSGDGKYLIGGNLSGVVVWETATGKEAYRLPYHPASRIATSRDGTTLAVSEPNFIHKENRITLWDLRSGKKSRVYVIPEGIATDKSGASIGQLSFLPDGERLVVVLAGRPLIVDLNSGAVTRVDDLDLQNTVVSADGKMMAAFVADEVKGVQLWNIETGKRLRAIANRADNDDRMFGRALSFSPDGKTLAVGANKRVYLFDVVTGNQSAKMDAGSGGGPLALAFTPDGSKLLCNHQVEWRLQIWDVANRKLLRTINDIGNTTSYKRPSEMALAPDGKTVAFGTVWHVVRFWNVNTGKELFTEHQGHFSQINSLAFAPNGKVLASAGGNGPILLWNPSNWRSGGTLPGRSMALSFSSRSNWLASGSTGVGADADVRVWDMRAKKDVLAFRVPNAEDIYELAFSPDGRKIYTLEWNQTQVNTVGVRQWNVSSNKQEKAWTLDCFFMGAHFTQDAKAVVVATVRNSVDILALTSGRTRHLINSQPESVFQLSGQRFQFDPATSPDAKMLALARRATPGRLYLWETASGRKAFSLTEHHGNVTAIAWSPDGRVLASGDQDTNRIAPSTAQSVKLWDAYTGTELASFGGFKSGVWTLAFSPDGRFLVAGLQDTTILVFDVTNALPKLKQPPHLDGTALESHWTNLIADDAGKAYRSIAALIAAPDQSVPFLQRHLDPISRADAGKIQHAIADLNSGKFTVRQAATKELLKIGAQVIAPIQKAMAGDIPLETRRRLEDIVNKLAGVPGAETLRNIRAIMVLERIGTPEARAVLTNIAAGAPGAHETDEAKASLDRLTSRVRTP